MKKLLFLTLLCAAFGASLFAQGQNFPGGSGSGSTIGSVFSVLNYGWVDDDVTDNCGAPVTNFLAAVNGYSGSGVAQVWIPEGTAGKAYKLATCNLIFTAPRTIHLWGTLDCAQSASFANCIQEGPSNLVAFTNAQTPPYTIEGTGTITGCVNVTVACIEAEPWVSNPRVLQIHMINVGAGNASPPACTNYAISFDGHNNAPQIIDTEYWMTDAVTGRCWSINNRTAVGGGTNSALIEHNTVIAAGNAPNFTTPCGSAGHTELGSATIIKGNQFYGFGQTLLLLNPQFGSMISTNQFDQAGCTTNVASADIQYGNGSNGAVGQIMLVNNYFAAGGGHAASAFSIANGSTSALSNVTISGNITSSSAKNIFPSATPPTCTLNCVISDNINFAPTSASTSWASYGAGSGGGAYGTSVVAQTANITATTLVTAPGAAIWRAQCYVIETAVGTTSTLPSCVITWTDFQTNVVNTATVSSTSAANTLGTYGQGIAVFATKASTAIQYSTTGYASTGTAMQYTIFVRAERLN